MQRPSRFKAEWFWLAATGLLLSLHFWFPKVGTGPRHDTYSTTAEGKKAFYLLVDRQSELEAERNLQPLEKLVTHPAYSGLDFNFDAERPGVVCLLGPARYPTTEEWDALLTWVSDGGSLLIAAREDEFEFLIDELDIRVEPIWETDTEAETEFSGLQTGLLPSDDLAWRSNGQVVAPQAERLIEYDDTLQAAAQDYGAGRVIVVASDFVFSNQSLAYGDNSVLAFRLLEDAGLSETVYFDESLNTSGTPKVVGLLVEPPFRSMTVQLLIALALFGWWHSKRFGPVQPNILVARHNIVDHTDTVGNLYYKSKDGRAALRQYLKQLIAELRLKSFKGKEDRILEPIAVRMGRSTAEIRQVLLRATKLMRTSNLNRRTAAEFIHKLSVIRQAARARNR